MPSKVVIVDYQTGNLSAVKRGIDRAGGEAVISSKGVEIENCDKLVLAGVGHFDTAMKGIREQGIDNALETAVRKNKIPVLGICLGMELMARKSEEGTLNGLGWIDAKVVRFKVSDTRRYKVPHIGWNTAKQTRPSVLMENIPESAEFYFNHSYYLSLVDREDYLAETVYETTFLSVLQRENVFGVQFHPEKSHETGLRLLRNFVEF